ncbi:hypothetical protein LF65_05653 [Clostridium beijerinckii]|uniref:YcfA-like protein n=1 Tax=Clostridium beijerinckii TaxID=1520 RepID=A0A0B5QIE8_CLOBE|nr:type II toxin-antitoxin system HicA family toxin [Clostridium beijerinckii]AJH02160.1 hypothetical protein LF65_05653 [Clostridium beijerinckii]
MIFKFKDITKILDNLGFEKTLVHGSHTLYKHNNSNIRIVIPSGRREKEVPNGLVKAIEKQLIENGIIEVSLEAEYKKGM